MNLQTPIWLRTCWSTYPPASIPSSTWRWTGNTDRLTRASSVSGGQTSRLSIPTTAPQVGKPSLRTTYTHEEHSLLSILDADKSHNAVNRTLVSVASPCNNPAGVPLSGKRQSQPIDIPLTQMTWTLSPLSYLYWFCFTSSFSINVFTLTGSKFYARLKNGSSVGQSVELHARAIYQWKGRVIVETWNEGKVSDAFPQSFKLSNDREAVYIWQKVYLSLFYVYITTIWYRMAHRLTAVITVHVGIQTNVSKCCIV